MNLESLSKQRRSTNLFHQDKYVGISYNTSDIRMYCGDDNCACDCYCPCNPDVRSTKDELLNLI